MNSNETQLQSKREVNWFSVVCNLQVAISCVCSLHFLIYEAYWNTIFFNVTLILLSLIGITAGSHRLWAHRSYKADAFLRLFLMLCQTLGGHTSIYNWVQIHRFHHQHFRTDLDPFNSNKGFIHAHFVSSYLKLSEAQQKRLKDIDMSDIEQDAIVMFQQKYYWFLYVIITLLLPINAPVEYWGESLLTSVFVVGFLRLSIMYHLSLLVHSGISIFDVNPDENKQTMAFKSTSHWPSYHYLTPWDYKTGEFGRYNCDCTTKFIKICEVLELASDLRTADSCQIREALVAATVEKKSVAECINDIKTALG